MAADDDGGTQRDRDDDATGDPPDPGTAGRGSSIAASVVVLAFLVMSVAIGTILVGLPPKWPADVGGWALLVLGAALTLFNAIAVPQYRALARRLTTPLSRPRETLTKVYGTGWKALAGIAVVVLVVGLSTLVRPPSAGQDLEPGNIVVLSAFSQSPNDPRRILINEWNQSHPDNQVFTEDAPGGTDLQHSRVENDAKPDGGAHHADVYALDNVWMSEFIQDGYIRPIDESLPSASDENFIRSVLATCKDPTGAHPGTWALPFNADAGLLFYRPDLLGQRDFATWDDYLGPSAANAFRQATSDPTRSGAGSVRAADAATLDENDEILTVEVFEAIWAAGGQVANVDGQAVLSPDGNQIVFDDQARQGLQKLAAAYADRAITLPDADTTEVDRAISTFRGGGTLTMRNWPVAFDKLRDPRQGPATPFAVAPLPGPGVLGGQDLAISSHTAKPRAAQAFIQFMTSSASELTLFEIGGVPPTRAETYDQVSTISRPYADAVRKSVQNARPRVVTPFYTKFSGQFRKGMINALRNGGRIDPDLPTQLATTLRGG